MADHRMLDTIILILKRAINNETWASINWQLPSPLNALALLTINHHNVAVVLPHFPPPARSRSPKPFLLACALCLAFSVHDWQQLSGLAATDRGVAGMHVPCEYSCRRMTSCSTCWSRCSSSGGGSRVL